MEPLVTIDADIDVDIHIHGTDHGDRSPEILTKLEDLVGLIQQLQGKVSTMATKADFDALVASVNTATNNIAARIQALEAKIAAGGMTADEEANVLTELASVRANLEALGADPENPVPPPV